MVLEDLYYIPMRSNSAVAKLNGNENEWFAQDFYDSCTDKYLTQEFVETYYGAFGALSLGDGCSFSSTAIIT